MIVADDPFPIWDVNCSRRDPWSLKVKTHGVSSDSPKQSIELMTGGDWNHGIL
jgi:hypothetical protein